MAAHANASGKLMIHVRLIDPRSLASYIEDGCGLG